MNERCAAYSEQAFGSRQRLKADQVPVARESHRVVDSLLHPAAVLIRQVLTRPGRLQHGLILIDDEENILHALQAGIDVHSVYCSQDHSFSSLDLAALTGSMTVRSG
ncbi:MAG: hypothetical protein M3Y68_02290, partial [Chloroflexota bacterium]|nr:hypothetical protein [Chloroflexota bacterium]